MKTAAIFALSASPALAHSGHIAETSGHSHWAIPVAFIVVGLIGFAAYKLKDNSTK